MKSDNNRSSNRCRDDPTTYQTVNGIIAYGSDMKKGHFSLLKIQKKKTKENDRSVFEEPSQKHLQRFQ